MANKTLFPNLLNEAEWVEWSVSTRLVWITLLAMADKHGEIDAHISAIAHRARVSLEDAKDAISTMLKPNPMSRFIDHQGRTLETTPRGWRLLQFKNYGR